MFFIFPVGSEKGVRRLPYFTIGLIAVCTLVWLITNSISSSQVREIEQISREVFEIQNRYVFKLLEKDPELLARCDFQELMERFDADTIIPAGTVDYVRWHQLRDRYEHLQKHNVFQMLGFVPKDFGLMSIFTALFTHMNFWHLLFNMLFLWLVGCNIEDDWSWKVLLGLYLVSGVAATLLHAAVFPKSDIPLVGASGAIAGIMGAFMIRHYKTKVRFAYFFWLFITRPYLGTFAVYAAVALPVWFLLQVLGAGWSSPSGTAYYAHIGGFVFGAVVGLSMNVFGWEKRYIAPMVEDSFEKLRVSPRMKEANRRLEAGDTQAALPLFLAAISEEPGSIDAPLTLARLYHQNGAAPEAANMYNQALSIAVVNKDKDLAQSIYDEMVDRNLADKITESNCYRLAALLDNAGSFVPAVKCYDSYTQLFPQGRFRPKAMLRIYQIHKEKLNHPDLAQQALDKLKTEYPDWA